MIELNIDLPEEFLEPEIRNGFEVTLQRKKLWAVELDLLSEFDQFCKQLDLRWCVGAGTMLGAVRHQGFIPWDDDIDIYMLREDYDRMCEHAAEFHDPYFLQNTRTEKYLMKPFSRLRNSRTTGSTVREIKTHSNRGIFIDIFPLDGISANKACDIIQGLKNSYYLKLMQCYNVRMNPDQYKNAKNKGKVLLQKILARLLIGEKDILFETFDSNLKRYSKSDAALWGNRTLVFSCPKSRRKKIDYQEMIYMPFEMLSVPVPRNFDSMLRQQYGDYLTIPKDKGQNMHGQLVVSTDYAYNDPRRLAE